MPVKNISNTRPMGKAALRTVERQRQMANALQSQAMQPLGGKMAGRVYVADGPFKGAAKLAQMLAGTYGQNKADEREAQIEADQRQAFATDVQRYHDAMKPTQKVIEQQGDPYEIYTQQFTEDGQPIGGNTHVPAQVTTVPGMSMGDASSKFLLGGTSEEAQKLGKLAFAESLKEPKLEAKILQAQQLNALIDDPSTPEDKRQGYKSQLRILQKGGENQRPLRPIHIKDTRGDFAYFPGEKHARPITNEEGIHLQSANYDPAHQQTLAQAKASGMEWGKQTTKVLRNLPNTIKQAERAFTHVKELLTHEGFEDAVGIGLRQLGAGFAPSSQVADWDTRLQQLKDGAFLVAFEELKGGGHITEIEGIKATRAKNRMLAFTSEDAFQRAAEDYLRILQDGLESAQTLAKQAPPGYYQGLKSTGALDSENFEKKRAQTSEGQSTVNNDNQSDLVESILQSEGIK